MDALTSPGPERLPPDLWRELADQLPQLAWITDAGGKALWFNKRSTDFIGVELGELTGEGWTAAIHPEALRSVLAAWTEAVATRTSYECQYPLRRADGQWRDFLARGEPHFGSDGEVAYWFGTSTDITDQVAAERRSHYLVELGEALRSANGAAEAKAAVVQLLGKALGADRVHFTDPDLDRGEARVTQEYLAPGVGSVEGAHRFSSDVLALYLRGEPVVTADYRTHPAFAKVHGRDEFSALPVRALLDIPLVREGKLLSILSVHQATPRQWTDQEVELAVATAERSWDLIERFRAEEQLRVSEQQARAAVDELEAIYATAPVGLTILDRDLRYVRVNERLAEINGIPVAEHLGKTVRQQLPSFADQAERTLQQVLEGGAVWGHEVSGATPAMPGQVRTLRANWLPIRASGGEVTGVAISAEDVTSQKQAEVALARSEAQFRTLAEALPGMLFIAAADGGNSYVNDTFARYTGLSKEELLGTGWATALHPDDVERGWASWNQAVQNDTRYQTEYRIRRHDGDYRWHAVSGLRVASGDEGAEQLWVGTCIDIHDRKLVEQEMQDAEARYRAVFEQAGVGVARVSPHGAFVEINDRYCEIVGRSREEILGLDWQGITHPDDVGIDGEKSAAMIRGESTGFSGEKRYLKPDGSAVWVNLSVGAQFDEAGQLLFFIPIVEDISARKAAEAALRQKEERYRALFELMEQGFCTMQVSFDAEQRPVDYRFTELNPAFTRHSGLSQDVLNRSVREAVPDLEASWFERYGKVASTGEHARFIDHAAPLGRWFEVYAFSIGDRAENNVAILFSDVTERVEQEEATRRSEQDLRTRLNAIPQMVWSTLPDGFHDFYNDRWYEFTGTPLGSTDGEGWNGMFHPEDQPLAWQRWNESLATGRPYEIEYRLRHHTGTYRWVLGRALPIRNEVGDIIRWMGTCTDIDDRIQADRALRGSEARLRAILEAVPVGLIFSDSTGKLTGGNHKVVDLIDKPLVESDGVGSYKDDYVAYHGDGRRVESEEYPLARALAGEERPELECQVPRQDGSLRWLRYVASAIRDDVDGSITGGVVASIDIDREKRLTEGLEREVELVVAEREAAQEALRQSQKLEAMGQLTGGVAHDFNNLLTPIIGSLDLLQRKQILDDRTGRLVEGALASAEKARVLVQRLLAFARRQPLKPQAIDLRRVVSEMSELVDSTSGPRIRVVTDLPREIPAALADGNQLEMALLNLSVNARDAMPEGGTLSIAARFEEEGSGRRLGLPRHPHVVLSVSDTGLGMDEDTRRRAIEPFFSTKGIGKGTGLGLSMVHGLAAQLGGALDIRSAPGMGTTIELWLPLAEGNALQRLGTVAEPDAQGAGTVLLVDDEELVRASTAGMLADLGYRVVEADSGEAALALVADGLKPNLLVTDQLMPGLSGTDLAVRLRETFAGLPVLVVSGYADLDSLSPAFPHLSKPFRQSELSAALEKAAT